METEKTKCLIIGSGPAGYTAAVYASRANLNPVLYQGMQPGGLLTMTTEIENFPGYPNGVSGFDMMEDLKKQAERFGTDIRTGVVTGCNLSKRPYKLIIDESEEIETETLIIATGASAKMLGISDEQKYAGKGVSVCATCDGFFYRKKDVAIVGGGDSACEEALYLAGLTNKVYMIVRKDCLRASQIMQDRVMNHPKIEILFNTNTIGLFGKEMLEGADLVSNSGKDNEKRFDIAIDGFFLAIGHNPNSKVFTHYLPVDDYGFIKTIDRTTRTHIPGVYAAGDVADPDYRQAITAAAAGCIAAIEAERYLNTLDFD
ncbi:MAG: thioredoxin-disulfide reductase [Dysgonamonadaceae bacterium]|jgi:thioredoxin reductase (NADPH)|nr:thioredoxin-disulfide reductase [Dysgonamonadaceae bacterium]